MLTIMKKIPLLSLILLLCLLGSCTLRPKLPPDYRKNNFEAEISWQTNGLTVEGIVSVRSATDTDSARLESLQFTAPETMLGLSIVWIEGKPYAKCHGMEVDASLLVELWESAAVLTLTGAFTPVTITQNTDKPLLYATCQDPSSSSDYEIYLDAESGFPQSIRQGEHLLTVRRFTATS